MTLTEPRGACFKTLLQGDIKGFCRTQCERQWNALYCVYVESEQWRDPVKEGEKPVWCGQSVNNFEYLRHLKTELRTYITLLTTA